MNYSDDESTTLRKAGTQRIRRKLQGRELFGKSEMIALERVVC